MRVEVNMIELTLEQAQAIAGNGSPPTVIDPTTKVAYTLVPIQELPRETPVAPWQYLVARRHPWRKQLYLKGRKITVRQLVGDVTVNKLTDEEAAANYHLPVEAIREAFAYFEANPEVIELDAAHERYLEKLRGRGRGPESVPR